MTTHTTRRLREYVINSSLDKMRPRLGFGIANNQAPVKGVPMVLRRALSLKGADSLQLSRVAVSTAPCKDFCEAELTSKTGL